MDHLQDGLMIFVVGMVILFLALWLLILIIRLLEWVFRDKGKVSTKDEAVDESTQEEQEALAAALAVGILLLDFDPEIEMHPGLGDRLTNG